MWEAKTLNNVQDIGILKARSRKKAHLSLVEQGYFQINLKQVPDKLSHSIFNADDILSVLNPLRLLLDSGIPIIETLDLLVNENKKISHQYIFIHLRNSLHQGKSLEHAFSELDNLFPEFFISMVGLCEKTGRLRQGLMSLEKFYQKQNEQRVALQKLTRYPKIVSVTTVFLALGVVIFIIPMFQNIYSLFKGDLPIFTKVMVYLSNFFHQYGAEVLAFMIFLFLWSKTPKLQNYHPVTKIFKIFKQILQTSQDPFLYAYAMKMLLDSGQSVNLACRQAACCMSEKNRKHGLSLSKLLNEGFSFSEAFQMISWFPAIFHNFISSAEKAGHLAIGFEQIFIFIEKQREESFSKWSKLIEPILMLILGMVVLVILLSVYLPVFDLGNRIG